MISFIIIGKNIANTIQLNIESVYRFIEAHDLDGSEIIFVDSDSTDRSIEIARQFPVKIIQLKGKVNSAVARNVGADRAKGDIFFFLDGDMELMPGFFDAVYDKTLHTLKYPFNRGYMKEKYYDSNFNYLSSKEETVADEPFFDHVTGGLMLIEKKIWQLVGGMDERLIRNQDLDLGLRVSKAGFPVRMDNHYWIIHHTTDYHEKNRFYYFLRSPALFSPGILMRKHFFNYKYLSYLKRDVFYVFLLLAALVFLFIYPLLSLAILTIYIGFQVLRTIKAIPKEKYLVRFFVFKLLYSVYVTVGFIFYFPKKPVYQINIIQ